jgi:hypothetical protein
MALSRFLVVHRGKLGPFYYCLMQLGRFLTNEEVV